LYIFFRQDKGIGLISGNEKIQKPIVVYTLHLVVIRQLLVVFLSKLKDKTY